MTFAPLHLEFAMHSNEPTGCHFHASTSSEHIDLQHTSQSPTELERHRSAGEVTRREHRLVQLDIELSHSRERRVNLSFFVFVRCVCVCFFVDQREEKRSPAASFCFPADGVALISDSETLDCC